MNDLAIVVQPLVTVGVVVTPPPSLALTLGMQGPTGPQGPRGAPGQNYTFTQASSSDTWVLAHNLNAYPSVTIVDSTGREVVGDVHYIDVNNVTIYFTAAFAGQAFLN